MSGQAMQSNLKGERRDMPMPKVTRKEKGSDKMTRPAPKNPTK